MATEAWLHPVDGSEAVPIPVIEGNVTLDSQAGVRGRCDIQVADADWIPMGAGDRLAPFGPEIVLRRGVYLGDTETETVSLGRFGIEDAEITDDGEGPTVRVTGLDRAERVSKAKFEDTFQLAPNTDFTTGILDVVRMAFPDVPVMVDFETASDISIGQPVTAQAGDDPWTYAQDLATAIGMMLFFDGDGVLTLRPYSDTSPVAELVEGEGGVLLTASRNWSRTGAFNKVVVTGENSGASVFRGVAVDDDPFSPTFIDGPFGVVTEFRSWPEVKSDQQARDVAESILAQEIGAPSTVSFGMVPNPALEPGDSVLISRPSIGVNETHVLDSLTIGLGAEEQMTGTTRERRTF